MEQLEEKRLEAKFLYWQGWRVAHIGRRLHVNAQTIYSWKRRDQWESTPEVQRVEASIERRLQQLIAKEEKSEGELNEMERLFKAMERTARIRRYDKGGSEGDLNPNLKKRGQGKRKKKQKNFLDETQIEALVDAFNESLFDYQRVWLAAGEAHRIRNILKSRQIGATWYFAREALIDAITTGRNQIFLSASKAQAHVFKLYILQFVEEITGVQLTGDPITLWNGATLYFLGTNARTAQSYHGNVYMDEYFWIPRFKEFRKVASGMAMHKRWRQTYISTPSALSHEAYPFWSGKHYNRGRPKDQHIELDVTPAALQQGRVDPDGQWRQVVTVEDAIRGGCDLFDIEQLRLEYGDDEYNNLLMCLFIDDSMSVFTLAHLLPCMVDSLVVWDDFRPFAPRPFANRSVWLGYDPSRTRDGAEVAVIAPPLIEGGKFRVLEKYIFKDMPFDKQAVNIEKIVKAYNVTYIGVDITGIGYGVFDLVRAFYPAATKISYSPEVKTRLVLKAQSIITNGRLEFDAQHKDIAQAFMSIRKTTTKSGAGMTYETARTEGAGHGDAAWAIMHALDNEKLQSSGAGGVQTNNIVEII